MIDIIIPVYNDNNNLKLCLASIAMQTINNLISVVIVDDASTVSYDELIENFSGELSINYYKLQNNVGAGLARQYGIEHSNNPYICFIDSDDLLYNPKSIEILFNNTKEGAEYISSIEYDEKYNIYVNNMNDLHGKMYSRQFLKEKNIKFNTTRFHEDCYFNNLVLICNPKAIYIDEKTYFYSHNKQSVSTLSRKEYIKKFEFLFYNIREILNYAYKINCKKEEIDRFIYFKNEYFKRVYIQLTDEEKVEFKKAINQYNLQGLFLQQ